MNSIILKTTERAAVGFGATTTHDEKLRDNNLSEGPFNTYVNKLRVGEGAKMSVFVHGKDMKTVHSGGGVGLKKWQNSVHLVVE